MIKLYKALVLAVAVLFLAGCNKNEEVDTKQQLDEQSIKVFFNTEDNSISANNNGIIVTIRVRNGYLHIRQHGKSRSFYDAKDIYAVILDYINSHYDFTHYNKIIVSGATMSNSEKWNIPIAISSYKSELYQDYRQNYPNSELKSLNKLFVDLANENYVYQEFEEIVRPFNRKLEVNSVEKVFTSRVSELTYKEKLIDSGIPADERVIINAGVITFNIIKN